MNKTVNINLAGIFFHIDEDAFAKLTNYLNAIRNSFSDPDGQDEIIKDIEVRISELFSEKTHRASQVVTLKELDEVISVMGQPEDYKVDEEIFNDSAPNEKQQTQRPSSHKQVFRDTRRQIYSWCFLWFRTLFWNRRYMDSFSLGSIGIFRVWSTDIDIHSPYDFNS